MKTRISNPYLASLICPLVLAVAVLPAAAAPIYWDGTGTNLGSWDDLDNWSTDPGNSTSSPSLKPGNLDDVFFNVTSANASNQVIHLNGLDQAAKSLTFNSTGTTDLNNASTPSATAANLALENGGLTVSANVGAVRIGGTVSAINGATVVLTDSATFTHNGASSLSYGKSITTAPSLSAKTLILAGSGVSEYNGINQASGTSLTLQVDAGHHSFRAGSGLTALTINGGTIYSRGSTQFGTTTPITFNGGTFAAVGSARSYPNPISIGGNFQLGVAAVPATIGDIAIAGANNATLSGAVSLNDSIRTITIGGGTQTISGVISSPTVASGGITVAGTAGILVLSNTNTYTGLTTVSGSTLRLGHATDTLSGDITVSGGTLNVDNPDTVGAVTLTSGTISGDSALTGTSYSVASGTISTALSGSGVALTKTTSGTVTLSGTNTYSGATTISGGTLSIGLAANLGDAASDLVFDGGTLQITGTTLTSLASLGRTNPVVFTAGKTVGLDIASASNTFTVEQVLNQTTGGFIKLGAGTAILDQTNTYTGATTLSGGTLSVGLADNLGDAASNLVFDGGTLQVTGTTLTSLASLGRTVVFNTDKTVSLDVADSLNTFTVGQVLNQGTGGFTKLGAGTVVLDQSNTYTGLTTVNAGTLTLAHPTDTLIGDITVNGGTLNVQNPDTVGTVTLISGTISGASTLAAGNGYAVQSGTFSSPLGGSGSLTKTTGGTVTLSGLSTTASNNYSGTTILGGGTLSITQDASFTGGLTFGATAASTTASALDLSTASATFGALMLVQTATNTNTITIGAGQKLTVNNSVNFGTALNQVATLLTVSGAGGWDVVSSDGTFAGTGTNSSSGGAPTMTVDMSSLAEFNANLRTGGSGSAGGLFRVGQAGATGTNTRNNSVSLATKSTISADIVELRGNSVGTNTLLLGDGEQIINSDTIRMGLHTSRAETSSISFRTANGTIKIHGTDGGATSRSSLSMITSPTGNANYTNTFNVTGHDADLLFDVVNVYNSTANTGDGAASTYSATFSFDYGKLDVTTFRIGNKGAGSLNNIANAVANIGSTANLANIVTLGTVQMGQHTTTTGGTANGILNSTLDIAGTSTDVTFATLSMANSTTNDAETRVVSAVNISGGTTTGTGGIDMLTAHTAGTATSTLTISGGSLSVGTSGVSATNGIYRGAATGTTILRLNGGSLDLNGNSIGGANAITTQFECGTLSNIGEINGGAGLTKTTAGTLILTGTNTYTGTTAVNEGTLSMSSPSLANASAVTIAPGAVLNLNYVGTDTVASLTLGATTHTTGTFNSANSGGLITGSGQLTVVPATTPYATWVALYPGFTNNLPGQDQDGDGMTNQEEFAFGLNPTSGSSVNPITTGIAPATGNFSYTRNANSGLTYKVWSSSDLAVWTERTGATQTPVGIPDSFGTQTVNVTTLGATAVGGKLFVRVTAE